MMFKEFKQSKYWNKSLTKCLHKGVLSFIRYSSDYGSHQLEFWREVACCTMYQVEAYVYSDLSCHNNGKDFPTHSPS